MITIKEALTNTEFKVIEKLANIILHEVYDPIIPAEHTRYFLERFQSEKAIENQVKKENYQYYLLQYKNENVGYLGIQKLDKKLILSKLYILKAFRGLKIGKSALNYIHQYATENHIDNIELIVNQQNQNTVEIYQKNGFKIIDSITNSFPNGHSVNDYKMEKKLV